jgi:hypothetical protein
MSALVLAILAIVGVGLVYWLLQQEIEQHKQQTRKEIEELEHKHESRIQEIIESIQGNYKTQLKQSTHELQQQIEVQLQEAIQSLSENHQTLPIQKTDKFTGKTQYQELPNPWEDGFTKPIQPETLLEKTSPTPLGNSFVNTPSPSPGDSTQTSNLDGSSSDGKAQIMSKTTTKKSSDIAEAIITFGNSRQVKYIPKLTEYINHPDSHIRESVASALGIITGSQGIKAEIQRAIPLLGKLSRDSSPLVRRSAVEALGKIKSEAVIPLLSLALRDSDRNVVKAASAALNKFKFYPMSQKTKPIKPLSKSAQR